MFTWKKWKSRMGFYLPCFFFMILALKLQYTRGQFTESAVFVLFPLWIFSIFAIYLTDFQDLKSNLDPSIVTLLFSIIFVIFSFSIWKYPSVMYATDKIRSDFLYHLLFINFLISILILTSHLAAFCTRKKPKRVFTLSLMAVLILFIARFLVIQISPEPHIDVFTVSSEAVDYLHDGKNPYVESYTDIYKGTLGYQPVYSYFPGVLLIHFISRMLFGDVRYSYLVADLLTLLILCRLCKKLQLPTSNYWLISLLWLSLPPSLFILESCWIDPLIATAGTFLVLKLIENHLVWAGITLGIYCSFKQYTIFTALLSSLYIYKREGFKSTFIYFLCSFSIFSLILLPFILWNPSAFFERTVHSLLSMSVRYDSLSIPSLFHKFHLQITLTQMTALTFFGLSLALILQFRSANKSISTLLGGLILSYGASFWFGKQAFCNYYYLIAHFLLTYLMVHPISAKSV